jgi:hypothetical protein
MRGCNYTPQISLMRFVPVGIGADVASVRISRRFRQLVRIAHGCSCTVPRLGPVGRHSSKPGCSTPALQEQGMSTGDERISFLRRRPYLVSVLVSNLQVNTSMRPVVITFSSEFDISESTVCKAADRSPPPHGRKVSYCQPRVPRVICRTGSESNAGQPALGLTYQN